MPDSRASLKKGYLIKRGHFVTSWKKRFFVLTEDELSYYSNCELRAKRKTIPLSSIGHCCEHADVEGKPYCLEITTTEDDYFISAPSEQERTEWLDAVRSACAHEIKGKSKIIFSRVCAADCFEDQNSYFNRLQTNFCEAQDASELSDSLLCLSSFFSRLFSPSVEFFDYELTLLRCANVMQVFDMKRIKSRRAGIWNETVESFATDLLGIVSGLRNELRNFTKDSPQEAIEPAKSGFYSKYRLVGYLGQGSYSIVHEAEELRTTAHFAVKVLRHSLMTDRERISLLNEITIMKTLSHPNILKMIEYYDVPARGVHIVTELAVGGDLFKRIIQKKHFGEREAMNIIRTIVETVQYFHSLNIVHRDLKPENILFTHDGDLKIGDFGFAKDTSVSGRLQTDCGSPWYVAPEIISSSLYGKEVDMWSLGVIMYIMLCGFPPFYDKSQTKLFQKIKQGEFVFLSPYWDNVSAEAKDLISHLLVLDPRARYDATQVLNHAWFTRDIDYKPLDMDRVKEHIQTLQFGDGGEVIRGGYLLKRGSILPRWKRQYFELRTDGVHIYKDQSCPKSSGFIPIDSLLKIMNRDYDCFQLHTVRRVYSLQTPSMKERNLWKQAISGVYRCSIMRKRAELAVRDGRLVSAVEMVYEARQIGGMLMNPDLALIWTGFSNYSCTIHGCAAMWPLERQSRVVGQSYEISAFHCCYLQGEETLLFGCSNGTVVSKPVNGGETTRLLVRLSETPVSPVTTLFSYFNEDLIIGTRSGAAHVFNYRTGAVRLVIAVSAHPLHCFCVYPTVSQALCVFGDEAEEGQLAQVQKSDWSVARRVSIHAGGVTDVLMEGSVLVSAGRDRRIVVWNPESLVALREIDTSLSIDRLVLLGSGALIVAALTDGSLHGWSTSDGASRELSHSLKDVLHEGGVAGLVLSMDGQWMASVGRRREILLWRIVDDMLRLQAGTTRESEYRGAIFLPNNAGLIIANDVSIETWILDWAYVINNRVYAPPFHFSVTSST